MSLTLYCSEADVEWVWSELGVLRRADDDDDEEAEAGYVSNAIEVATTKVNKYLLKRYTVAAIAASTWAKWATAYIAAYQLGIRRGNSVPQTLADEYERYIEDLKAIESGANSLPADDGLAAEQFDNSPSVTNYTVDGRYARAKIRRVPSTSTGGNQSPGLKQNNLVDPNIWGRTG